MCLHYVVDYVVNHVVDYVVDHQNRGIFNEHAAGALVLLVHKVDPNPALVVRQPWRNFFLTNIVEVFSQCELLKHL